MANHRPVTFFALSDLENQIEEIEGEIAAAEADGDNCQSLYDELEDLQNDIANGNYSDFE